MAHNDLFRGMTYVNLDGTFCRPVTGVIDPHRGVLVECARKRGVRWYADPAKCRLATADEVAALGVRRGVEKFNRQFARKAGS